jgi:hypothetical protein
MSARWRTGWQPSLDHAQNAGKAQRVAGMNEADAIAKARAIVFARTGVDADPDTIEFKSIGGQRYWTAYYGPRHFFPKRIAAGATIDGGECIVEINDKTGEVTVFA